MRQLPAARELPFGSRCSRQIKIYQRQPRNEATIALCGKAIAGIA